MGPAESQHGKLVHYCLGRHEDPPVCGERYTDGPRRRPSGTDAPGRLVGRPEGGKVPSPGGLLTISLPTFATLRNRAHSGSLCQTSAMGRESIFLIQDEQPVVLEPTQYEDEDLFQELLAKYPNVLVGATTDGEASRKLLLVQREIGVASAEGASDRFSLDHLFLDDQGVPIIVEVKRSSDTRIRRHVVGQMLDYAANATRYWPIQKLRDALGKLCQEPGGPAPSADEAVRELSGGDDPDEFWQKVEDKLRAGHVRMVFVADRIPDELQRIIEFLNLQMSPAEVLGVEVPQYVGGDGIQVVVPRLVGATTGAADKKHGGTPWTEERFLQVARERGDHVVALFRRLFEQVESAKGRLNWGRAANPGVSGWFPVAGELRPLWTASTGQAPSFSPYLYFTLAELHERSPERVAAAVEVLGRAATFRTAIVAAHEKGFTGLGGVPSFPLDTVASSPSESQALLHAIDLDE